MEFIEIGVCMDLIHPTYNRGEGRALVNIVVFGNS